VSACCKFLAFHWPRKSSQSYQIKSNHIKSYQIMSMSSNRKQLESLETRKATNVADAHNCSQMRLTPSAIKDSGVLVSYSRHTRFPVIDESRFYLNFMSTSYLGISQHPGMIQATVETANKFGTGSLGSKPFGGITVEHQKLANTLKEIYSLPHAILVSSV
jgi:7-keto-8-aminopelargonate synthetase-like enzyme